MKSRATLPSEWGGRSSPAGWLAELNTPLAPLQYHSNAQVIHADKTSWALNCVYISLFTDIINLLHESLP
jgi:hypothetical protein